MHLPIAEEAFLAGMIHDLGLLVSLQSSPDSLRQVCQRVRDSGESFCEVEQQLTGVDHQQLGAGLTAHWRFPRSCQLVAGYHHRPTTLSNENRELVTLIYVADTLCCQSGQGFGLTAASQAMADGRPEDISLTESVIEGVRERLPQLVADGAGLFG
jgi:HD-like signal output (HDOD) protein